MRNKPITSGDNQFRRIQGWAQQALYAAFQAPIVLNGVARCIAEERVLILQLLRSVTTNRVTVIQHPQPSVAMAYAWLASGSPHVLPVMPHNDYFIVASTPALATAEQDGVPYMRALRPSGFEGRAAEILRVPFSMPARSVDRA